MKFTCYYKSDIKNPIIVNNPNTGSIYTELGISQLHLVRLTRFYEKLPEHLNVLFSGEKSKPIMSVESKAFIDNQTYNTHTTIYECEMFDTDFITIVKKTPNKKTILLIIHKQDGFKELEEKFDVFNNAKIQSKWIHNIMA